MRSVLARLSGISVDFSRIPPRWDEYLSYEHGWVDLPVKVGKKFL